MVRVYGYDDTRKTREPLEVIQSQYVLSFRLGPKQARNIASWELEEGTTYAWGRIGDGTGKWTLGIWADGEIEAMSLLYNRTGHITNLSL